MIVTHEVESVTGGGRESRANGSLARIGNGTGRQPGMKVGVVRRIKIQVTPRNGREGVLEHAVIEPGGINHSRIASELHVEFQAPGKNARDNGAFQTIGRLLLHQRGQRDHVMQGRARLLKLLLEFRIVHMAKTRKHSLNHRRRGNVSRETVGVGKKISFQGRRLRIKVAYQRCVLGDTQEVFRIYFQVAIENRGDIKTVRALWNQDRMKVNVPPDEFLIYVNGTQGPVEKIFTGFQSVLGAANKVTEKKRQTAGQDAALDQTGSHVRRRCSRFDQ